MDKNKIIKSVKRQEEEKVAVSLKLPASLKEQLQKLGEEESISMNSLIVATLHSLIDDDCGKELRKAKDLLLELHEYIAHDIDDIEQYGIVPDNIVLYTKLLSQKKQIEELRGE
ncbi:hypothetical protein [Sulfurimonas sp.]|uniref:hypothetical protein n=1 Tax=Sulfurimonas sp. TaxID=2022749 RepID=UPI00262AA7C6|nr:hypothetical protein [Sulfurimonas sp.]MDD5158178.1 hypothetical protein [Sulfurimonas sp.]